MRLVFHVFLGLLLLLSASASSLSLTIEPRFQGEPLRIDSMVHQTAAGETISMSRLSYLLGGFALQREDGSWLELPKQYAWMDAATRRKEVTLVDIPQARYQALRFHVGPDAEANAAAVGGIAALHPLNPNVNSLHWSWQGGYIFLALEGYFRVGNEKPQGFAWHLARDPNRTMIHLSTDLNLTQDCGLLAYFDLAHLLNAPRPLSFRKDGVATHSREGDPIAAALVSNLQGAFRVHQVVAGQNLVRTIPASKPIDFPAAPTPYRFTLSKTFPLPALPLDNPLIIERIELGKKLFHDTRLSRDQTISCASCHDHERSFTDGKSFSRGVEGRIGTRNSMSLINLAWKKEFFWDGRASSLREQVLQPIADHQEMDSKVEKVAGLLARDPQYQTMFAAAFRSPGITPEKMALCLEQFLLTLTARDAKFDRAMNGAETLTAEEQRGFELFMTEYDPRTGQKGADCFHCHGGALFSDHQFHNNGLSGNDAGRAQVTGNDVDRNKFATPSLRNVALTAPYMHDGRFATLEEVIDHYTSGVQSSATLDPSLAKHPAGGLPLSLADKAALVAFLKTLTEHSLVKP